MFNKVEEGEGAEESDSDGGVLDINPETGKLRGDVPTSEEIPDESVEQALGEVEESLGVRQIEQMDKPKGNPNGTPREQDESKRYQNHEERIDREGKLHDDLVDRL